MAEGFSAEAIAAALQERWDEWIQAGERFEATLDTEGTEARVVLALVDADGAARSEFEVRAPVVSRGAAGARDVALDAADALIGEWLEDGRPRLPGVTQARDYDGIPVQVTARRVLPRLQAEADRLLGEDDEGGLDS